MTAADLLSTIARGTDRHGAAVVCDSLKGLTRPLLCKLLTEAGVEVRPADSKKSMLTRLGLRLTAGVRAVERTEV